MLGMEHKSFDFKFNVVVYREKMSKNISVQMFMNLTVNRNRQGDKVHLLPATGEQPGQYPPQQGCQNTGHQTKETTESI